LDGREAATQVLPAARRRATHRHPTGVSAMIQPRTVSAAFTLMALAPAHPAAAQSDGVGAPTAAQPHSVEAPTAAAMNWPDVDYRTDDPRQRFWIFDQAHRTRGSCVGSCIVRVPSGEYDVDLAAGSAIESRRLTVPDAGVQVFGRLRSSAPAAALIVFG